MEVVKALPKDLEKLYAFYKYVIDNTDGMKVYCRWIYGKHPTDEMIAAYTLYQSPKTGVRTSELVCRQLGMG